MNLPRWVVAACVIFSAMLGALVGQWYVTPPPKIAVEFTDNSCAIRCPAHGPYASQQGSTTCVAGSAPLCQCTDAQKLLAGCVPVN